MYEKQLWEERFRENKRFSEYQERNLEDVVKTQ
jgi:hypothetical protein